MPSVIGRVILFSCIHSRDTIETPKSVYVVPVRYYPYTTSAIAHWCYHRPLVGVWVVRLGIIQAFLAIESTTDIYFTCYLDSQKFYDVYMT